VRVPTCVASEVVDYEGNVTPERCDFRAIITRGAVAARPGAALILGGLLLLTVP